MPWPIILIAGLCIPGSGQFLRGERQRGIIIGGSILALFILGLLIGGVRVVEFPDLNAPGNLLSRLLTQPTFLGQMFAGVITFVAGAVSAHVAHDPATQVYVAHSRIFDIGALYTAIAGALNLLAVIDATGRAAASEGPRDGEEPLTEPAAA